MAITVVSRCLEALDLKYVQEGTSLMSDPTELEDKLEDKLASCNLKSAYPFSAKELERIKNSDKKIAEFRDILLKHARTAKNTLPGRVGVSLSTSQNNTRCTR